MCVLKTRQEGVPPPAVEEGDGCHPSAVERFSQSASNRRDMGNDRALGTHLGYLAYHVEGLSRRRDELTDELEDIRENADSRDERIKKERSALKDYRSDVSHRIDKLEEQIANSIEDAPETAHDRAIEIRESAITTHLEEDDAPDAGFQTASDLEDE